MSAKVWEAFRPGEFTVPSAAGQFLSFIAPGSTDPNDPKWVTYPGETRPLVGRVLLAGAGDRLLVQPPNGQLICINGQPVKLTPGANTVQFRRHISTYRRSVHSREDVVRLATELLAANRRPDDAKVGSFMEFTRCRQPNCGIDVRPQARRVEKSARVPENVFYIERSKGAVVEDFLEQNACLCVLLHRNR